MAPSLAADGDRRHCYHRPVAEPQTAIPVGWDSDATAPAVAGGRHGRAVMSSTPDEITPGAMRTDAP